jgi:hypothetical protein
MFFGRLESMWKIIRLIRGMTMANDLEHKVESLRGALLQLAEAVERCSTGSLHTLEMVHGLLQRQKRLCQLIVREAYDDEYIKDVTAEFIIDIDEILKGEKDAKSG